MSAGNAIAAAAGVTALAASLLATAPLLAADDRPADSPPHVAPTSSAVLDIYRRPIPPQLSELLVAREVLAIANANVNARALDRFIERAILLDILGEDRPTSTSVGEAIAYEMQRADTLDDLRQRVLGKTLEVRPTFQDGDHRPGNPGPVVPPKEQQMSIATIPRGQGEPASSLPLPLLVTNLGHYTIMRFEASLELRPDKDSAPIQLICNPVDSLPYLSSSELRCALVDQSIAASLERAAQRPEALVSPGLAIKAMQIEFALQHADAAVDSIALRDSPLIRVQADRSVWIPDAAGLVPGHVAAVASLRNMSCWEKSSCFRSEPNSQTTYSDRLYRSIATLVGLGLCILVTSGIRLRESVVLRKRTAIRRSSTASSLPPNRTDLPLLAAFAGLIGAVVWVAYVPHFVALDSQSLLFVLMSGVSPKIAQVYAHRRYGPDPPLAKVGFMLILSILPNWIVLPLVSPVLFPQLPPDVDFRYSASLMLSLAWALAMWTDVYRRSQRTRHLSAKLEAERSRADAATRDRRLAEAKLQILQAQIEPHFLYNTLANVQHLVKSSPDDAERMVTGLIRYLREALPKMRAQGSTVGQEFALAHAYLEIARIRLGGRLSFSVRLPDQLGPTPFPPLIIQTLVENALKHGVEAKVGPAAIRLDAELAAGDLCVSVSDDGPGMGTKQGVGVGLRNIRERLLAIYGGAARLELFPNQPSGICAKVFIPRAGPPGNRTA